jgi:4-hydroxy-tetrahydrodipicolinate reductase
MSGIRIGLFGAGKLGSAIAKAVEASDCTLAWQVGRAAPPAGAVDCAVDASVGAALEAHLEWALEAGVPLVVASTGWSMPDLRSRVGERIGVLVAPNLSMTVALYARLAQVLARYAALEEMRDPYIVEHHHRAKLDAPSGTARMLAEKMIAELPSKERWVIPHGEGALKPTDLSVSSVRGGYVWSSHVVGLDTPGEALELVHRARDYSPYSAGALTAARWLVGRTGVFDMEAVASEVLDPLFTWKKGRA